VATGCVKVASRDAERALKTLGSKGLVEKRYKPKQEEGKVLIPVTSVEEALEALRGIGVEGEGCEEEFQPRRPLVTLEDLRREAEKLGLWRHSYHQVGDIIVFNAHSEDELPLLRELALLYKERLPHARAFYAKLETQGEERVARLIHLAGERRTKR